MTTSHSHPGAHAGFLAAAPVDEHVHRMFETDLAQQGYVANLTRLWAHAPAAHIPTTVIAVTARGFASAVASARCWRRRLRFITGETPGFPNPPLGSFPAVAVPSHSRMRPRAADLVSQPRPSAGKRHRASTGQSAAN